MYTKAQKRFWLAMIIIIILETVYFWYMFQNIRVETILWLMLPPTLISALMHRWGISIVRRKDFRKSKTVRQYPTEVDCWNTVLVGVPGVTFLLFMVPIAIAYLLTR